MNSHFRLIFYYRILIVSFAKSRFIQKTARIRQTLAQNKESQKWKIKRKALEVVETGSFPIDNNFHCDATQRGTGKYEVQK